MSDDVIEEIKQEISDLFGKHVVAITWWEGVPNDKGEYAEEPTQYIASGFVIEMCNLWWLVTAGHVTIDYRERKATKGVVVFDCQIWDCFGKDSITALPYYFDIFDPDLIGFEQFDKGLGLDYAIIRLPHLVERALSQNIVPFRKVDWMSQSDVDYHSYFMCGIPAEFGEQKKEVQGKLHSVATALSFTVLRVEQIELPEGSAPTLLPQFIGRVPRGLIDSIRGMSGGPIIGVGKLPNGETRYFPIAVQSRWDKHTRIINAGCIEVFGRITEETIRHKVEDWEKLSSEVPDEQAKPES
jgi:hypothetical protein